MASCRVPDRFPDYSRVAEYHGIDGEKLFRRKDAASELAVIGFPVAASTLATKATRGGGPPFRRFGNVPLYKWRDLVAWANTRLGPTGKSSSELDAKRST